MSPPELPPVRVVLPPQLPSDRVVSPPEPMAPPRSPEDLSSSEDDLPGPSTSQEKKSRWPHPSQEDQPRGLPPRAQHEPRGTDPTQEDYPRSLPPRPQHEPSPQAQNYASPQPAGVEEGDVDPIVEADVQVLLQEEDVDEDDDDDDEEEVIIMNSAIQLTEFSWISRNKFKDRKSILVNGYNFQYHLHEHNEQKTSAWYR